LFSKMAKNFLFLGVFYLAKFWQTFFLESPDFSPFLLSSI
jgi:hypothetical protein